MQNISRFCDVVMKGGVTSGVVYPLAICKLASKYLLKHIGGTSVGAIAAAITAAAEYRRRTARSDEGYALLAKLPAFLQQKGILQTLFTADPGATAFLNAALQFTGRRPMPVKVVLALAHFWLPTFLTGIALYWALYGVLVWIAGPLHRALYTQLHWGAGWLMLLLLVPAAALVYYFACVQTLDGNDFGLVHGYDPSDDAKLRAISDASTLTPDRTPRLIGWLHAFIQQTAGRTLEDDPLTFGDLIEAPNPEWHPKSEGESGIDLRLVTTCVTLGRPFELPFDPAEAAGLRPDPATDFDETGARRPDVYFKPAEMQRLFPPQLVAHLVEHSDPHSRHPEYFRFPAAHATPIVVAARFSMSFPILFCAVKLYATDVNDRMQPIWFSDGGVTSNFPIHFFDSPLPRWPTFAFDLLGSDPETPNVHTGCYAEGAVFLESTRQPGTVNPWNRLGKDGGSTVGFLAAILDTARTWLDETSGTLWGNSSRTVGIRLRPEEGGINLAMPPDVVEGLVERGARAGDLLIDLFAPLPDARAWQDQRWYRYRGALGALTRWLEGFEVGYAGLPQDPQANYDSLVSMRYDAERVPCAQAATRSVAQLESVWRTPPNCDPQFTDATEPRPLPVFAQRRPL
jgi:predicted acylesterase/phospholipase RssA